MKVLGLLATLVFANSANTGLMSLMLLSDNDEMTNEDKALLLMLAQNGQHGSEHAQNQMNSIMPLLMLSKRGKTNIDNSKLLLTMLISDPTSLSQPNTLLPYLLLKDDNDASSATGSSAPEADFMSLFVISSMIQRDCEIDTNAGLNMILPFLIMEETNQDDMLKVMLMMQMMGQGNSVVQLDLMMPYLLMLDDNTQDNNMMLMVMLSSMSGGLGSPLAYQNNFNMLLPLALIDCDGKTGTDLTKCEADREKMIVLLMAMQSSAPGSPVTSQQILPLLLMKDNQSNEELIVFMTMMSQQKSCLIQRPAIISQKAPPVETIYRTFSVDPITGERTLISESTAMNDV